MRFARRRIVCTALLAGALMPAVGGAAEPWEQRSVASKTLYKSVAMVANVLPGASSFYAPKCLPGYVFCKAIFAGISVIAAAEHLLLAGDGDLQQTRGILYRGFAGDWFLTGRHITGDRQAQPLPDPPPPSTAGGAWEPPPR